MLALLGAAVADTTVHAAAAAVTRALVTVRGPYAVIFYAAASRRLYYARDPLARRSLLRHASPQGGLVLSSVAPAEGLPPLPRANNSNSSTAALQLDSAADSNDSGDDDDALDNDATHQQQQQQQQPQPQQQLHNADAPQQQRDSPATAHTACAWQELPATGVYWIDLSSTTTAAGADSAFVHGHEPWQGAVTLHLKQHTNSSNSSSSSDSSSANAVGQSSVQSLIDSSDAPISSCTEPCTELVTELITEPIAEPIAEQEVPAGFFTDEHRAEASALLLAALRQSVYRRISTIPVRTTTTAGGSSIVAECSSSSGDSHNAATADSIDSTVNSTTTTAAGADISSAALDLTDSSNSTTTAAGDSDAPVDKLQLQLQPARVGVLFSGGLDSVVLAALVAECNGLLTSSSSYASNSSCSNGAGESPIAAIDLINVCFDAAGGHSSPDRKAAVR
jgi:hypothetical protein